jgi:tetratricopeptide (TPR) repeat protein
MPEPILLLIGLVAAGFIVLIPLWRARVDAAADDGAAALRHRVALEVLRDVETDRRAGSLDDAAYAEQLAQAEARAADTRAALEGDTRPAPQPRSPGGRRSAVIAAAAIGGVMLAGSFVPPAGIANQTVVNQELADAEAAEAARQALIRELRGALSADAADTDALSALADAHLAGSSQEDLVRGAVALQLLIALEPERADAYERIMSAYLRAGDHANARAAHDAYVQLASADPVEAAFFDGLIALRGVDDPQRALDAFDRFLELAPDDPRAAMVRGLRDEAGGS